MSSSVCSIVLCRLFRKPSPGSARRRRAWDQELDKRKERSIAPLNSYTNPSHKTEDFPLISAFQLVSEGLSVKFVQTPTKVLLERRTS
jgi:hypothetical protein